MNLLDLPEEIILYIMVPTIYDIIFETNWLATCTSLYKLKSKSSFYNNTLRINDPLAIRIINMLMKLNHNTEIKNYQLGITWTCPLMTIQFKQKESWIKLLLLLNTFCKKIFMINSIDMDKNNDYINSIMTRIMYLDMIQMRADLSDHKILSFRENLSVNIAHIRDIMIFSPNYINAHHSNYHQHYPRKKITEEIIDNIIFVLDVVNTCLILTNTGYQFTRKTPEEKIYKFLHNHPDLKYCSGIKIYIDKQFYNHQ